MFEKPQNSEAQKIRRAVIETAKKPVPYLERNFHKGALASLNFLVQVRQIIKDDASYEIESPDPDFKKFYLSDNATPDYYEALIAMLKRVGFNKVDVASALMENLPHGAVTTDRATAIRKYAKLTENAVNQVYDEEWQLDYE